MKIYCAHSLNFDYKKDYYDVLRNELGNVHTLFFPHQTEGMSNSKDIIRSSDLIIAEISYPSIGLGIELGWAESFSVPILALYRVDSNPSRSISFITKNILEYQEPQDLINKVKLFIQT